MWRRHVCRRLARSGGLGSVGRDRGGWAWRCGWGGRLQIGFLGCRCLHRRGAVEVELLLSGRLGLGLALLTLRRRGVRAVRDGRAGRHRNDCRGREDEGEAGVHALVVLAAGERADPRGEMAAAAANTDRLTALEAEVAADDRLPPLGGGDIGGVMVCQGDRIATGTGPDQLRSLRRRLLVCLYPGVGKQPRGQVLLLGTRIDDIFGEGVNTVPMLTGR